LYYSIRHVTRFRYSAPISESVMEVRMQPRTEAAQRCLSFNLSINPRARVMNYRDHLGNNIHHFDIPGQHTRLVVTAEALVEMGTFPALPDALSTDAWAALDQAVDEGDYWEFLMPSHFATSTALLHELAAELGIEQRRDDPLSLLREINTALYDLFTYKPQSTDVDSPIDDALRTREGVCQDYSHVMITLVRELGIPCRYVSGYLYHHTENDSPDRSAADATHAWVEAFLPELGWVSFDPTNDLIAGERHIRAAVGRDYADVPPTRGVFRGSAESDLSVAVAVKPTDQPATDEDLQPAYASRNWSQNAADADEQQSQQQQ
jgi:transglutaminase-like putative cysteine protease